MKIFTFFPNGGSSVLPLLLPRPRTKPLYENLYVFSKRRSSVCRCASKTPVETKGEINWDLDPFLYCIYGLFLYLPPCRIIFHCKINMSPFNFTSQIKFDRRSKLHPGYVRLSLSSHFHARLKLFTNVSSCFNAPQFWSLTQHGKRHMIFHGPPFFCLTISFLWHLKLLTWHRRVGDLGGDELSIISR